MPDWPARMDAELASLFLGIGETTFLERVKRKEYPQPVREDGRVLWSRVQLDRFVMSQFGIATANGEQGSWDD